MKSIIFSLMVFVISITARSQENYFAKSAEERAGIQTNWMKQELGINSQSISKVYQINLKYAHKAEEMKTYPAQKWRMIRKIKTLNEKKTKELSNVLSKEQFDILLKRKSEIRVKIASMLFQMLDKKLSESKMALLPTNRNQLVSDWMRNELSLDSLTSEKVARINLKYANKLDETGSRNERLVNKIRGIFELQKMREKELSTILSKKQFDRYLDKKREIRDRIYNLLYSQENTNSTMSSFERAKLQTDWMKVKFQLDSVTACNVFNVNLKFAQKIDVLSSKPDLIRVNQLIYLVHRKDNDLRMVFSQEQYEKYIDWKKKIKENSRNFKIKPNSKSNQI